MSEFCQAVPAKRTAKTRGEEEAELQAAEEEARDRRGSRVEIDLGEEVERGEGGGVDEEPPRGEPRERCHRGAAVIARVVSGGKTSDFGDEIRRCFAFSVLAMNVLRSNAADYCVVAPPPRSTTLPRARRCNIRVSVHTPGVLPRGSAHPTSRGRGARVPGAGCRVPSACERRTTAFLWLLFLQLRRALWL